MDLATGTITRSTSWQGLSDGVRISNRSCQVLSGILSCHKRLDIQVSRPAGKSTASQSQCYALLSTCSTLCFASASRIGTAARVIIKPEGGYKQPCILWTANVSHSGQAKKNRPLEEMESQASELYDAQLQTTSRMMTTMLKPRCGGVYSTMSPHRLRFACTADPRRC